MKNQLDIKLLKRVFEVVFLVVLVFMSSVTIVVNVKGASDADPSVWRSVNDVTDVSGSSRARALSCGCLYSVMEHIPLMPDPAGAAPKPQVEDLPSEFNWRNYEGNDWTTPAKSQGGCGSCWDFAALGALEAVINIEYGDPTLDLDLSEQYVLSCLPAAGDCGGGHSHRAFEYIKSEEAEGNYVNGIIHESCFPYQADDTVPCSDKCPDWETYLIPISDYGYWYPNIPSDRDAIKSQLTEKGPIVTYLTATDDFINWGSTHHNPNDYYPYPGSVETINHAVVIVGYKDDPTIGNGGYWIIKNSWGTGFGYEGFYNVEYGSLHHGEFIVYVEYECARAHELSVFLETPQHLQPGETSMLNATVHNGGLSNETNVEIHLLINGTEVASETLDELVNGTWHTINHSWTPTTEGTYNITAYAPPVPGENVTANNVLTQMVLVQTLPDILIVNDDDGGAWINGTSMQEFESALTTAGYDYWVWNESSMGNPPLDFLTRFQLVIWTCGDYWSEAVDPTDAATLESYLAQGGNILLEGEDIGYDHGADSFMVNVAHAIMQVDDTGAPGLTVTDPAHPVTFGLPNSFTWLTGPPYYDGVSPTNGGAGVIQYTGTEWTAVTVFEGVSSGSVVYYAFPLYCLEESHGELLAINSIDWLQGERYEHEITVALEAPDFLKPDDSSLLNATVWNRGLNNETDVELFLLINGTIVNNATVPELVNGTSYTIDYLWTPSVEGIYNLTAYAPPVPSENITVNNIFSIHVLVSYAPKILAYVEYTHYDEEYVNAFGAIESTYGSNYILSELWDHTQLDFMLPGNDILFVPEQENGSLTTMFMIGTSWSTTLFNFVSEGGIIIVCDFSGGSYGILTGAGLMAISGVNYITGSTVYLVDPSDPLAEGVSNTFVAPNGALSFITAEANVVFDNGTNPVVIHKIIGRGHIALIGFDYYASNPDADQILGNAVGLWVPARAPAYLVVRGSNNRIYYRVYNSSSGSWGGWNVLPGSTCDSPAAAVYCSRLHIIVRGMDGYSLWHGWINLTDNSFDRWTRLSGSTPSAPTLASNGNALYLVVRGFNDRIYYRSYGCVSHAWEEWNAVPTGATCDSPAAAMVGGGLHVVVRGMDEYSLWHGCLTDPADPESFSVWTRLSGSTPSAPTLASNGTVLSLVVRGFNDRIYYRIYEGSWGGWNVLPGATCDSPGAALLGNDLHIVVRGLDGNRLWHGYLADPSDPESFSGWSWLSGATPSAPTLTS